MVSLEKWMILTPLLKLSKNGEDWGKLIVAKAFKKLPKIQNIAQSGHTAGGSPMPPGQHVMNVIYDYGFVLTGNIPTYCTMTNNLRLTRGGVTIQLTFWLNGFDSTRQLNILLIWHKQSRWIQQNEQKVSSTVILPLRSECFLRVFNKVSQTFKSVFETSKRTINWSRSS